MSGRAAVCGSPSGVRRCRGQLAFTGRRPLILASSPCPCGMARSCGTWARVSEGPGQQNPALFHSIESKMLRLQVPGSLLHLSLYPWLSGQGSSYAGQSPTPTAPCRALRPGQKGCGETVAAPGGWTCSSRAAPRVTGLSHPHALTLGTGHSVLQGLAGMECRQHGRHGP